MKWNSLRSEIRDRSEVLILLHFTSLHFGYFSLRFHFTFTSGKNKSWYFRVSKAQNPWGKWTKPYLWRKNDENQFFQSKIRNNVVKILFTSPYFELHVDFRFFHAGVSFHFGLFDRSEITPEWSFTSLHMCIQHVRFVYWQKWFHFTSLRQTEVKTYV